MTDLNINDSLLGSRGTCLLIQALRENESTGLQVLKMRGNNLNPANIKAFVEAFKELPGLRHVEIADNNFTTDDVGYNWSRVLVDQWIIREETDSSIDNVGDEVGSQTISICSLGVRTIVNDGPMWGGGPDRETEG